MIFPDPVDPPGQMIFGAEGGLEKTLDDLAVGKGFFLGALPRGDGGNLGEGGRRQGSVERDGRQGGRERQ